ncbi:MAG TPA: hypothetical protein VFO49_16505 [Nocardioides sp.]|nr:hypothetical protein [Nocardioides sp.]
MDTHTTDAATTPRGTDNDLDRRRAQRDGLRLRHAKSLSHLMSSRHDLRGVHALADLVDESVRWTA